MTRQKWGQNFLVNDGICRKITGALNAGPEDAVVEIGPGRGALTKHLAGKVRSLTVVELDASLVPALKEGFGALPGVEIVNADALSWVPAAAGPFKVISNLPYSAGNAILQRVLDWPGWTEAVVMVQKEVAVRMAAGPGSRDYGILSLAVQAKSVAKRLFDVAPGAFRPPPKVVSTVLRLTPLAASRLQNEPAFFRVVHAAFGQRRKTLLNSLSHGLQAEKSVVEKALRTCGLDPEARAETLPLEKFEELSRLL